MPEPNSKKRHKEPSVSVVSATTITKDMAKDAFKAIRRIPPEQKEEMDWDQNGQPRRRSANELEGLLKESSSYAAAQWRIHSKDFSNKSMLDKVIKCVERAYFEENREYLYWASELYLYATNLLISSRELNPNNIKWANALATNADLCYDLWALKGCGGDEFRDLGIDVKYNKDLISYIAKMPSKEIHSMTEELESDLIKYKDRYAGNESTGQTKPNEAIRHIEEALYIKFEAMVCLSRGDLDNQLRAARLYTSAAETAISYGLADYGKELAKKAHEIFIAASDQQSKEGKAPSIDKPGTGDYVLFHDNLAKILSA